MSGFYRARKARMDDVGYIMALESDPSNQYVHASDQNTHKQNIEGDGSYYLIAEDEAENMLGYAILADDSLGRMEWRRIIIAEPSKGVGKAFMQAIIDHFRAGDTKSIWLDVYEDNARARHVYQSLGFRETKRSPQINDPSITMVVMELSLA